MFSSTYPLGTAIHHHQARNVELRVTGSARFSDPSSSIPNLSELELLSAIKSGDVWVSSQPSLQFRLCVRIHGHLQARKETDILYSDMAEILGRAQLWSDLHFVVASQIYDVPSHKPDIGQLNIALRLQQVSSPLFGSKPARLPSALSALFNTSGDIHTPPEILKVVIREVDVALDFFSTVPSLWPIANNITPQGVTRHDDDDDLLPTETPTWPQEVGPWGATRYLLMSDDFQPNSQVLDSGSEYDGTWESLDDHSPFSSQQSHSSDASTAGDPKISTSTIDRFASISLLDSGIRSLVSPTCFQTRPTIKCRVETETTYLADLAPSIFNPGYRTAISQRACFIPSIAKGITSLLSNTYSPLIKSQLQTLETSFREMHLSEKSHTPLDTNGIIKCLLWKTMQHGLHDSKRGPQLSPLDANTTYTPEHDTLFYDDDEDEGNDSAIFDRNTQWNDIDDFNYDDNSDDPDEDILTDNLYPDSPVSLSCMVDDFSDAVSESSLIFGDADSSPLPAHASSLSAAPLEAIMVAHDDVEDLVMKSKPQLSDSEIEEEMLDCSSPAEAGPGRAPARGMGGDSEMLLF